MKNIILSVIRIQIGLGNGVLRNMIDLIDSGVEKLSTGEEFACNTLVTVNQVISKRWQYCQMRDSNYCVILRHKYMQLKKI